MTKKYKGLSILFGALMLLATFLPIIIGLIMALMSPTVNKTALSLATVLCIILGVINLLAKCRLRSIVWILLAVISLSIGDITGIVIMMSICTILDEFIFTPLCKHYIHLTEINKQIDKRL